MNFAETSWLYWIPALLIIALGLGLFGFRKRDALLEQLVAPRLREQLTLSASKLRSRLKLCLLLCAVVLITLALARPQLGIEEVRQPTRGVDVLVVLDVSRSMLANDLSPTRLDRAKLAANSLVNGFGNERVGLVVFAGQAFLLCPLTRDYRAFRESLRDANTDTVTRGGTDIGAAIMEAAAAFPQSRNASVIVLITDGEDLSERVEQALGIAEDKGITVHTVGIGTPEGSSLRIVENTGIERPILDQQGRPVISRLDEQSLRLISRRTGGRYERLSGVDLSGIQNAITALSPSSQEESSIREIPKERFQWPLAAALALLLVEPLIARRRKRRTTNGRQAQTPANLRSLALLIALGVFFPGEKVLAREAAPSPRESFNQAVRMESDGDLEGAREAYRNTLRGSDFQAQRDAFHNLARLHQAEGKAALQEQAFDVALEAFAQAEEYFAAAAEIDPDDTQSLRQARLSEAMQETIEALLETLEPPENQENEESAPEESEESEEGSEHEDSESGEQSGESADPSESDADDAGEDADETESSADGQESTDPAEQGAAEEESAGEEGETSEEASSEPLPEEEAGSEGTEDALDSAHDEQTEDTQAAETAPLEVEEGMSEDDALRLIESMRRSERFLPFTAPPAPRDGRRTQDW